MLEDKEILKLIKEINCIIKTALYTILLLIISGIIFFLEAK